MGSHQRPSSCRMMHQGLDQVASGQEASGQVASGQEALGQVASGQVVLDRDLAEEHPFQEQMDRVGEVVHHHLHHIFHTSPGSFLPSILSIPLPSLYMLPLDGCPSYSKDVDYHTQIYHVLQHRDPFPTLEVGRK